MVAVFINHFNFVLNLLTLDMSAAGLVVPVYNFIADFPYETPSVPDAGDDLCRP